MGEGSTNALKGKRVVVTRAAEQSGSLVKALRDSGAMAVVLPMVAFAAPDKIAALDEAIRGAGRFDWMLLTSQNALRALQERCEILGVGLAQALDGILVAAVGPATAETAKSMGLEVEFVAVTHRGVELAEELGEKVEGKHVFLPRSDRAYPELVGKLKELGAEVTDVVAYKTVRPDDAGLEKVRAMMKDGADAVLFFSPSAVHHFREVLGDESFDEFSRRAVFAAIGAVTESALHKTNVKRVVLARDTTVEAVLAALNEHFTADNTKLPAGAD